MSTDVTSLLHNCQVCRTSKAVRQREHGLLNPLPVPDDRWTEVTVDFVGPLPGSQSFEGVWCVLGP